MAIGLEVRDAGDCVASLEATASEGIRNFEPLIACLYSLKEKVAESLQAGNIPVVMGGEHTLAAAGVSAALERFGGRMGLLWIDAHADIHTPGSSESGNGHGMPLAALAGLPSETDGLKDAQWRQMQALLCPHHRLDVRNTAWFGLRDVDLPERRRLIGKPITMHRIDRHGVEPTLREIDVWFRERQIDHLWISFDVDALDPILAPGTGTAVRGGLTYRETHLLAELVHEALCAPGCSYCLAGVDIVETNPLYDTLNQTAEMAVEWLSSLFGKTIL